MHIAIIMDGNGRWATRRKLPRTAGHREGAKTVDAVVEAAAHRGIQTLTLYAFSADNWQRPPAEVKALFVLLRRYLFTQTKRCVEQSIRINCIGRRDRLERGLLHAIEQSEQATARCTGMHLRIAVDYSSQYSLMEAARRIEGQREDDREHFLSVLNAVNHSSPAAPEVDFLVRTGGEKRLSDFLLWECAYAELHFEDCLWPDFGADAFNNALDEYARRNRRFGRVPAGPLARTSARL